MAVNGRNGLSPGVWISFLFLYYVMLSIPLQGSVSGKGINENCTSGTECDSTFGCFSGVCNCDEEIEYYNDTSLTCFLRKSINENCTSDSECDFTLGCFSGNCDCDEEIEYYNDTSLICSLRKSINENCTSDSECDSTLGCFSGTCDCDEEIEYYNDTSLTCSLKKPFGRSCDQDWECQSNFGCYEDTCGCDPVEEFFNADALSCQYKKRERTEFGKVHLNMPWNAQLNDTSSMYFIVTKRYIESMINYIMSNQSNYIRCDVNSFSQGNNTTVEVTLHALDVPQNLEPMNMTNFLTHQFEQGAEDRYVLNEGFVENLRIDLNKPSTGVIIEEREVEITCQFLMISNESNGQFSWFLNDDPILTERKSAFSSNSSSMNLNTSAYPIQLADGLGIYVLSAALHIEAFTVQYIGNYKCRVNVPDTASTAQGQVIFLGAESQLILQPRALLRPQSQFIKAGDSARLLCNASKADAVSFVHENGSILMDESFDDLKEHMSVALNISLSSSLVVKCIARNTQVEGLYTDSNNATVDIIGEDITLCPESEDRRGIMWAEAPSGYTINGDCPDGYSGYSTRLCNADQKWEETDFVACTRDDLKIAADQLKFLEETVQPSSETLENISTGVSNSISGPEPVLAGDIVQVVEIVDTFKNLATGENENEDALISSTTLDNLATISDKVFSADAGYWEQAQEERPGRSNEIQLPAARLIVAIEQVTQQSLKDSNFSTEPIIKPNIVIKRDRFSAGKDVSFPESSVDSYNQYDDWVLKSQTSASLSSSSLPVNTSASYSIIMYNGIGQKLKITNGSHVNNHALDDVDKEITSNIISFSTNVDTDSLSTPLTLSFPLNKENFDDPLCVFLVTSENSVETGEWSTEGCRTVETSSTTVECHCDHLTNFAILMTPIDSIKGFSDDEFELEIITWIGCCVCIVCLVTTIIVLIVFWKFVAGERRTIIHLHLCVCLIVAYIVFLAGIEETGSTAGCTVVTFILHFVLLAAAFVLLCEGIELFTNIVYIQHIRHFTLKMILFAYGIPLVIAVLTIAITQAEDYESDNYCWLTTDDGMMLAFAGPALFAIAVNILLIGITISRIISSRYSKSKDFQRKAKSAVRPICVVLPVMTLTWFFGVFSVSENETVFQYIFAILSLLQGLLIFFVYCILSSEIRYGYRIKRNKPSTKLHISDPTPSLPLDMNSSPEDATQDGSTNMSRLQFTESELPDVDVRNRQSVAATRFSTFIGQDEEDQEKKEEDEENQEKKEEEDDDSDPHYVNWEQDVTVPEIL